VSYIDELRDVIWRLHGSNATHVESVPVKEEFGGKTVWEGIVEVFELHDHPKANRVYAWAQDTGNPERPVRHVTALHIPPITSAILAAKAAILEELRNSEPEEA
jgi:hypothetical protein